MKTVRNGDKTELRNRLASAEEVPCDCGHHHLNGRDKDCIVYDCPCQQHFNLKGATGWEQAWEGYVEFMEERAWEAELGEVDDDGLQS